VDNWTHGGLRQAPEEQQHFRKERVEFIQKFEEEVSRACL
jgi:hypothetical protein